MADFESARYNLEYPYQRTTGPVTGPFLTALRDGKLLGIRAGDRILCPPLEFDPDTLEELEPDFVEVGPYGVVVNWTWVAEPTPKHPLEEPFAFATIALEGSDTPIVHVVKASSVAVMARGLRVKAMYREQRVGAITDVYFVPENEAYDQKIAKGKGDVEISQHLISLDYEELFGPTRRRYLEGLARGVLIGQKSPASGKVYIPSKGYDPIERVPMTEADDVELPHTGTICSYTIITPTAYYGQKETEPYIRASILLDDSDDPLGQQDIRTIPLDEMRAGMRVKCIFKPEAERDFEGIDNRWGGTGGVIERWEPTGEPDIPFEVFSEHVY
ncbi:MAG: hypothetical protein GY910_17525 [bacterium]|nr:hypothetical protein [Deltaproteobacteria bacterium]MCP4906775.1 hypothetical protein [bacterium]